MPKKENKSYGPIVQARTRRVLQAILLGVAGERDLLNPRALKFRWQDEVSIGQKLTIEITLQTLVHLTNQDGQQPKITTHQIREALEALRDFLGILQDNRTETRGSSQWNFTLTLSSDQLERNLRNFDDSWERKRSPKAKLQLEPKTTLKSGLRSGAPFPRVRLPENYVERPKALEAVKGKLFASDDRTLVVSAIAGLGGLGKSVVAIALVLDQAVQSQFCDGILWVTLGQNPDLQTLLGDWIRTLDKSRGGYSATTLQAASDYLHTLLIDKRMLLVVDDAWNGAHVEPFRVGGAACRVLVTTREAQIERAKYHQLDLMSEREAISLVRQKLGEQWQPEQEPEVRAFAKSLGYLPLALDLAANQVREGISWTELRSEFETERRAVAIEVLNSSEAWECLDEQQQRKYSLQACFNLSVRRLSSEQLQQFAWLGVLPEDVSIDARMATTLWNLSPLKAKKALIDLRKRSFLTDSVSTVENEPTYRVHDLLHDVARGLIEQGKICAKHDWKETECPVGSAMTNPSNLALAHIELLERYRRQTVRCWNTLPNDGYIYRHLTWHLEQAGLEDEIHALLAMSDERGRNAWFEVCDRIGQPAIFVQDVSRAWAIAERRYQQDPAQSVGLQCRYALITATLNSLADKLSSKLITEFVKRNYWTPEQAWAYVNQMQEESNIADAISELAPHLPESIFGLAVEEACSIQSEFYRAEALSALVQTDPTYSLEVLAAARSIRDEHNRAKVLCSLAQTDLAYFPEALAAARLIRDEHNRAMALCSLAQIDLAYLPEALAAARAVARATKYDGNRAMALCKVAQINPTYFSEALAAAQLEQDEVYRTEALSTLAQIDGVDLNRLFIVMQSIQNEVIRTRALINLARINPGYFSEALLVARLLEFDSERAKALSQLAQIDSAYLSEALATTRSIEREGARTEALCILAQIDPTYFWEALAAARSTNINPSNAFGVLAQIDAANCDELFAVARLIQDETVQAEALSTLIQIDSTYSSEVLAAAQTIQNEYLRAEVLHILAQVDSAYFSEALAAARAIQNDRDRAKALYAFAQIDSTYFSEALAAARVIQDDRDRAEALCSLAQIDSAYFSEALAAVRSLGDPRSRAWALCSLAQINSACLSEALVATRLIDNEVWHSRVDILRFLVQLDFAYLSEALAVVRSISHDHNRAVAFGELAQAEASDLAQLFAVCQLIQDEFSQATILRTLVKLDSSYCSKVLKIAQSIQDELHRANVLSTLAQIDPAYSLEALTVTRSIQDESLRAQILESLAKVLPESLLPQSLEIVHNITRKSICARAFRAYLFRLPLTTLPPLVWQTYLHLLAHCNRRNLVEDLVVLYPAIVYLGETSAVRGMVDAMRDVCSQWR